MTFEASRDKLTQEKGDTAQRHFQTCAYVCMPDKYMLANITLL